ncbi:MAG: large conductance mechanosensitive channel protein MscL [Bacilli bacterium]|nr:large conductance mechanosensitive channel protein MscL [Bacilli bacterium]
MKKFFSEFKKFISRGNVVDMAVGVIIGGAFTAIVTALTNGILKPLINWIIAAIMGGEDASAIYTMLKAVKDADGVIDMSASIYIDWGALISAVINFFLIALVLFVIIKAINGAKDLATSDATMEKVIAKKQEAGKKLNKKETAYLAKKEADAKAAEEAAKAEAAAAAKLSRSEQLLTDIKALLEKK